jgi:hypothetical protein
MLKLLIVEKVDADANVAQVTTLRTEIPCLWMDHFGRIVQPFTLNRADWRVVR